MTYEPSVFLKSNRHIPASMSADFSRNVWSESVATLSDDEIDCMLDLLRVWLFEEREKYVVLTEAIALFRAYDHASWVPVLQGLATASLKTSEHHMNRQSSLEDEKASRALRSLTLNSFGGE